MKKRISFFLCFLLVVMVIATNMQTSFAMESQPEQTEESDEERVEEVLENKEEQGIESEIVEEDIETEQVNDQSEEVVKKETEAKIAPTSLYVPPTYDGSTQRWTINSGEDLHYALAYAVNGDTFVIMNDLHMGSNCGIVGHTHNSSEMDGVSEELVVGPGGDKFMIGATEVTRNDLRNTTLNFISGSGSEINIYRNDHKRHLAIGKYVWNSSNNTYSSSDVVMNVTLNFNGVTFNGNQTYDVNSLENEKNNVNNSSRGGVAIYNSENVTINGMKVINCFSDTMNAQVNGKLYMGRDLIANGGALNGWYAKNLKIDNSYFEGNYSGGIGGAIHLQSFGGSISNTTIKDNHSLRFAANGRGGGIYYSSVTDDTKLDNVVIDGNTAIGVDPGAFDYGGGVAFIGTSLEISNSTISNNLSQCGGGIIFAGKLILDNVDITGNTATDETRKEKATANLDPVGGGIASAGGSLELKGIINVKDNKIQVGNYANYGEGAGMSLEEVVSDSNAIVTVSNNIAIGKVGTEIHGGGVYVSVPASNVDFSNWLIENNHIQGAEVSLGGGVYANVNAGDFTLTDSKVSNNSAQYGGGLFVRFNNLNAKTVTISNAEISGNTAIRPNGLSDSDDTGSGAGIYAEDYEKLFTDKVIFKNNNAEYGHAQPIETDPNYTVNVATHDNNIKNTVELSTPYDAGKHYAYNNYDINYVGTKMLHTVAYDANGGSGGYSEVVTKDSNYTIKNVEDTTISRDGYTFIEWNTSADGSGDSFSEGTDVTITANKTLYAIWEINTYTITYHPNEGIGDVHNVNEHYQASHIILNDLGYVREGYSLVGWNTKMDGSGKTYLENDTLTISENITLYAQWQKEEEITPPVDKPKPPVVEEKPPVDEVAPPIITHPSTKPDTDVSSDSNQKQQTGVKTGDATNISLWIVVMLLMTGVVVAVKTDRKHS